MSENNTYFIWMLISHENILLIENLLNCITMFTKTYSALKG